ncbi:MAG: hypothetical protein ACD_11C00122G0001 [uncultured bacterium]|nr:MAG: hypothetical protein ACD_11C00122G0001 [uncultured bacterium]
MVGSTSNFTSPALFLAKIPAILTARSNSSFKRTTLVENCLGIICLYSGYFPFIKRETIRTLSIWKNIWLSSMEILMSFVSGFITRKTSESVLAGIIKELFFSLKSLYSSSFSFFIETIASANRKLSVAAKWISFSKSNIFIPESSGLDVSNEAQEISLEIASFVS